MALKTYVLLDHLDSSANIYLQVNQNTRIKFQKRPVDHAYLEMVFTDRAGQQRNIRLKLGCPTIDRNEQIKVYQIPANEKHTQEEKDALRFKDGVNVTDDELVQTYLEASPQFEDNWDPKKDPEKKGRVVKCNSIHRPMYKIYDRMVEVKSDNAAFKKRLSAAIKVGAIDTVEAGSAMLLRLFGTFHKVPETLDEIQNQLVDYLDEADDKGLDLILKEEKSDTVDETISVLIGKAINLGIITFDKKPDEIGMMKNEKYHSLRTISSEYSPEQRLGYFVEFLATEDGKPMLSDIQAAVIKAEKKK